MKKLVSILCVSALSLSLFAGCCDDEAETTTETVTETTTEAVAETEDLTENLIEDLTNDEENYVVTQVGNDLVLAESEENADLNLENLDTTKFEQSTKDLFSVLLSIAQEADKIDDASKAKFQKLSEEIQKYAEEVEKDTLTQDKVDEYTVKYADYSAKLKEIAKSNNISIKTLEELSAQ